MIYWYKYIHIGTSNLGHPSTCFRKSVTLAYVSIRQHTLEYVSIRQHTSIYVSIQGTYPFASESQ